MDFTPILKAFSSFFTPSTLSKKNTIPLTVMILSPHPDDEAIIGSLPLRLLHENNANIINVAVTLGSKKERQAERLKELKSACKVLKMECVILNDNWDKKAIELRTLIQQVKPTLIVAPHIKDFHSTHIKSGELLKLVLPKIKNFSALIAWSEFWGQMKAPNILVEVPLEILQLQMEALLEHKGEISRNPYHLRLPAWMMDNVRRGSEVIGGKGESSSVMAFGVLYKLQIYSAGKYRTPKLESPFLSSENNLGQIFKLIFEAASGSRTNVK